MPLSAQQYADLNSLLEEIRSRLGKLANGDTAAFTAMRRVVFGRLAYEESEALAHAPPKLAPGTPLIQVEPLMVVAGERVLTHFDVRVPDTDKFLADVYRAMAGQDLQALSDKKRWPVLELTHACPVYEDKGEKRLAVVDRAAGRQLCWLRSPPMEPYAGCEYVDQDHSVHFDFETLEISAGEQGWRLMNFDARSRGRGRPKLETLPERSLTFIRAALALISQSPVDYSESFRQLEARSFALALETAKKRLG